DGRVAARLETSCAQCHAPGAALPFYHSLPGAGRAVADDVARGNARFLLTDAIPGVRPPIPSEVALARIERVLDRGVMPPTRYVALHWNASLTEADRALIH